MNKVWGSVDIKYARFKSLIILNNLPYLAHTNIVSFLNSSPYTSTCSQHTSRHTGRAHTKGPCSWTTEGRPASRQQVPTYPSNVLVLTEVHGNFYFEQINSVKVKDFIFGERRLRASGFKLFISHRSRIARNRSKHAYPLAEIIHKRLDVVPFQITITTVLKIEDTVTRW